MASKKLSELIRELRESKGLSQQTLAERASVTQSYVAIIESGQQGTPPRGDPPAARPGPERGGGEAGRAGVRSPREGTP